MDGDATEVARDVLRQYAELIEERRKTVAVNSPNGQSDMRTGWLLWQESLEEFLYFEEEMLPPVPDYYWAEWKESGGGRRKKSKNLWVYENESGIKRYSITTSAGPKIQPYFDVPPPNDPNIVHFCVQGEYVSPTEVRIWVTKNTESLIIQAFGGTDQSVLDRAIGDSQLDQICEEDGISNTIELVAVQVQLSKDSYLKLKASFDGKSDEHLMQLFLNWQAQANGQ